MNNLAETRTRTAITGFLTFATLLFLSAELRADNSMSKAGTEEEESVGPRLYVDSGPEEIAFRGWPLSVRYADLRAAGKTAPIELTVVSTQTGITHRLTSVGSGRWWLSEDETRALATGEAKFSAGGASAIVVFADPPPTLTPEREAKRRGLLVGEAIARGDVERAQREAEAWQAGVDPNDAAPFIALGDVAMARRQFAAAHTAYQNAIQRLGHGHASLPVQRKARAALSQVLTGFPTIGPGAPRAPNRPATPAAEIPQGTAIVAGPAANGSVSSAQWATSALASSEYRATNYGAMQATDGPNVAKHGDNGRAWAAKAADQGEEWLELTFARPVRATGVRVVQSFNPGAIVRIEVIDVANVATVVWRGPDATAYAKNEVGILAVNFPPTAVALARVKIVLDEKAVAGWNEIDAVQLVGTVSN